MNETRSQQEPSMEEILASIRRIISEDTKETPEPAAEPEPEPAPPPPVAEAPRPAPAPVPEPAAAAEPEDDDILELTEVAEDEADFPPARAATPPRPAPRYEPPPPEPSVRDLLGPSGPMNDDPRLVSNSAAEATRAAFARLVDEADVPFALSGSTPIGAGLTVEDIVRELLRPMLRDWLDRNLPGMVERIVEREVSTIGRRVGRR